METHDPTSTAPSQQNHESLPSTEKLFSIGRSEKWRLVNGFSNDQSDRWVAFGSPRTSRRKLLSQVSPGTSNSLRNIYNTPSFPTSMTSEGIVVQALNVVSDQSATQISASGESNVKKISKRRRKANGGVDVEHSKSSNEFLRKLQLSLRDNAEDSEGETLDLPEGSQSHDVAEPTCKQSGPILSKNSCHSEGEEEASTTSRTTSSTRSDSSHRTSHNIHQVPSSSTVENNPYGYEDPDSVATTSQVPSIPRVARRRNSVTEHTIREARMAAAFAAAERAQRLGLSRIHIGSTGQTVAELAAAAAQRLQNLQGSSSSNFALSRRHRSFDGTTRQSMNRRTGVPDKSCDFAASDGTNPCGNDAFDTPGNNIRAQQAESSVNSYGYEDPDALPIQSRTDVYGYEDPDGPECSNGDEQPQYQAQPRPRRRYQRRGSVTKYSLSAAKNVAAASSECENEMPDHENEYKPVIPVRTALPARTLSPKPETTAPAQPFRKTSPWRETKRPSALASRASALSRSTIGVGPPVVHIPPKGAETFRSNRSRGLPEDSSDDEGEKSGWGSDDESIDDSVASITLPLKDADEERDGPMRPPRRHDSVHSYASRGSTHSVRSADSDGDSLASGMQSLCSISQHERSCAANSAPAPPLYLPHTPKRSRSRHFLSSNSASGKSLLQAGRGEEGSAPLAYIDTSPLSSPKKQGHSFQSRPSSFNGRLVLLQSELPDELDDMAL